MNIEITYSGVLQVIGAITVIVGTFSFLKKLVEMYRDVRCNEEDIEFLEHRVEKLHQKIGLTKNEAFDWSESGKDVKGTGIVGEVEAIKEQMQEIARKVAQLHTS